MTQQAAPAHHDALWKNSGCVLSRKIRYSTSGFIAPQPLELSFSRAEIGTLFLSVLISAIVAGDGRSNWYKGVQLMLVYAMIAIFFYFLPEASR
jgi:Ca2+/Na+ antiporter